MTDFLAGKLKELTEFDLFRKDKTGKLEAGVFVGRPFYLDYDRALVLVTDSWKNKAGGTPQGSFLLAYNEVESEVSEALLLRVIKPTQLPTHSDVISSMIEYYKDDLQTSGENDQLDTFTRFEFSFSGLECRTLGTYYLEGGRLRFGADVENFYSAHNYVVHKPGSDALGLIANYREEAGVDLSGSLRIGKVRYSSSTRFQSAEDEVPVYVQSQDFLGKRTALFGMTRTGKSNTVKKIIDSTTEMSEKAKSAGPLPSETQDLLDPFVDGLPKLPVGQIVFDINGEYANANLQDEGTAIFEKYEDLTHRYSVISKPGFKVMMVNFYQDVDRGFDLVRSHLESDTADYVQAFTSIDLTSPDDESDFSAKTRYERRAAAYQCCLYAAGLEVPETHKVFFTGSKDINQSVKSGQDLNPKKGLSLEDAKAYWDWVFDHQNDPFFQNYKSKKGRDWIDEDLKAILEMLSRKGAPGGSVTRSGFKKLTGLRDLHTPTVDKPFSEEIVGFLRDGSIVIVDLSQGNPETQRLYSESICREIFGNSMASFINSKANNFVQFYFEEAHNLFPKKDDKDLSQIYNRIAKEGAKLNLGMVYATQEVSSISSNILKNTQNWFIAHLNNEDETRELQKYYDFADFTGALVKFSANLDKGFVRMKTYSNPYVVPVQIDRFTASVQE